MAPILAPAPEPDEMPLGQPWEQLRRMRASPPPAATKGHRQQTFQASLAQFEALYKAAEIVSNDAKPILLFYGVSQAVRAVAAAASALTKNDYLVEGHGQKVNNLQALALQDLECVAEPSGAFPKLTGLLGMQRWSEPVSFGQLWAALPLLDPLADDDANPRTVSTAIEQVSIEGKLRITRVTTGWLPRRTFPTLNFDEHSVVLQAAMDEYPALRDTPDPEPHPHSTYATPVPSVQVGQRHFKIHRGMEGVISQQEWASKSLMAGVWLTPRLGGCTTPPAYLGLWWSLLHALSMRARYEPRGWRQDLDLESRTSSSAVPLDKAMTTALTLGPSLVASAIRQVS